MNTTHAIVLGSILIAAAVGIFRESPLAQTSIHSPSFMLATTGERDSVWRINTETGQVSQCVELLGKQIPKCSPWSEQ